VAVLKAQAELGLPVSPGAAEAYEAVLDRIDPDSIRISLDNEALCGLQGTTSFRWAGLEEGLQDRQADLLLANILADVLCQHAARLCAALRPGGWLVLSGILAREVQAVHAAFSPHVAARTGSPPPSDSRSDGDWADLRYRF